MSDSQSATNFQNAGGPPIKRGLAAVPSWMLSLVLHGALIVALAAVLAGRTGGIVGDPNGDFRRIGIYVGHSGGDGKGDGAGDDTTSGIEQHAATQKSAELPPPAPVIKPEKPAVAATPEIKEPSTPASKPQPDHRSGRHCRRADALRRSTANRDRRRRQRSHEQFDRAVDRKMGRSRLRNAGRRIGPRQRSRDS